MGAAVAIVASGQSAGRDQYDAQRPCLARHELASVADEVVVNLRLHRGVERPVSSHCKGKFWIESAQSLLPEASVGRVVHGEYPQASVSLLVRRVTLAAKVEVAC